MAAPGASPDELPIDVELIKVLASDSRRDILRMLGERRKTLTELAEALGLKKATVLEHLQKLVEAGLIRKLDEGERLWIYYELTPRGKRLVRPERTRFYLILGGTAVAAVLLGVVLATGVLTQMGSDLGADNAGSSPESAREAKSFDADAFVAAPRVAWRGLDDGYDLRVPSVPDGATLILRGPDGAPRPLEVVDDVARLDANALDALPAGAYALSYLEAGNEVALPETFAVRDPAIAVFPRVIASGANETVEITLVPPGQPAPTNATVVLAGVEHALTSQSVAFLPLSLDNGSAPVKIGRLHTSEIVVAPAFDLALEPMNGSLQISAAEHGAPLEGAEIALDGASLGRTNATGAILVAWPDAGERAIRVVAADGRAQELAYRFTAEGSEPLAPALRIDAYDARLSPGAGFRVRADVFNDGPAEALVTIAAREGDSLLATALTRIPSGDRQEVLLESPLAAPSVVDITAHAAQTSVAFELRSGSPTSEASAGSGATAPQAPAAAPPPSTTSSADQSREMSYYAVSPVQPVVARDTIVLAAPVAATQVPDASASEAAARAPGPTAIALVAVVAIAALALRKRR